MSTLKLVSVSGNLGSPSRTRVLVDLVVEGIARRAAIEHTAIEVAALGSELSGLVSHTSIPPRIAQSLAAIQGADLLVVGSPVYKGSYTGLFKHLIDFVDPAALIGVPVLLTATGGTDRHALVIEHQLRPLFGFFQALTLPTGVYARDSDFENYQLIRPEIEQRIAKAVDEAVSLAALGRLAAPAAA